MNLKKLGVMSVLAILCSFSYAGEPYDGWGETPEKAMDAAMKRAAEKSPGGCICKNWGPKIDEVCKKAKPELGGFTCSACGSNQNGSCESQAEIDRIVRDVGKLKSLQ